MQDYSLKDKIVSGIKKTVLGVAIGVMALTTGGCYTHATFKPVPESHEVVYQQEKNIDDLLSDDLARDVKHFLGRPIQGDYDSNPDLDFIMVAQEDNKTYNISVHEEADRTNIANLNKVRELVEDAIKNGNLIYARGKYSAGESFYDDENGGIIENGVVDPFYVGEVDAETGNTKPVFTESTKSALYSLENDYLVDYILWEPSGVHIVWDMTWMHYPRAFYPGWDSDGDGIPNWRDPWPYTFGPFVDTNGNGIIDAWDIRAGGTWGWYGYYWHNFYPRDYWWYLYDNVYVHHPYNWTVPYIRNEHGRQGFTRDKLNFLQEERRKRSGPSDNYLRDNNGGRKLDNLIRPDQDNSRNRERINDATKNRDLPRVYDRSKGTDANTDRDRKNVDEKKKDSDVKKRIFDIPKQNTDRDRTRTRTDVPPTRTKESQNTYTPPTRNRDPPTYNPPTRTRETPRSYNPPSRDNTNSGQTGSRENTGDRTRKK